MSRLGGVNLMGIPSTETDFSRCGLYQPHYSLFSLHTTPTNWPWNSPADYSDDVITECFYILLMRDYPHPHKVGNEGSGSAHALTVYCNEYGKMMYLVRLLPLFHTGPESHELTRIDKYLDSWLNRTQFVKILTDSHSP